jgi:hypothetical protein
LLAWQILVGIAKGAYYGDRDVYAEDATPTLSQLNSPLQVIHFWGTRVDGFLGIDRGRMRLYNCTVPPSRSFAVLASPLSVINDTLDHLHTLSQFLLDEVDERVITSQQLTTERRLCKEALQTIKVLIPKLEAVRSTNVVVTIDHPRACISCDD